MIHGYELIRNQIMREGISSHESKHKKRKRKISPGPAQDIAAKIWAAQQAEKKQAEAET